MCIRDRSGTYTVNSSDDGTNSLAAATITLNDVAIADEYGNGLTATDLPDNNFTSNSIEIDLTKPSLQTISATKNGAPIAENTETLVAKDDVITFTFGFNEPTRLSGDATITLNSGGTVTLSAYDDTEPDPQNPVSYTHLTLPTILLV